jgi:transcriptional regulator with XRE-family HTH domain
VPGLRRQEVAMLAGLSVESLTRLERGNANGVSDSVLDALARALRLDEAEASHLFDLARFCFLDARAEELYPNWDDAADTSVALLASWSATLNRAEPAPAIDVT